MSKISLPSGYLDELKSKLNIVDIVGETVVWDERKSSRDKLDMWARCPFHEEASASFHVDGLKGYYYCFGCHAKGDMLGFVKETKRLDYHSTVLVLARKAGMPISLQTAHLGDQVQRNLIELKDFIVEYFDSENFLEIGVLTGWTQQISNHPRLLRSLSWGDEDYPGCVLQLLANMEQKDEGSIQVIRDYIDQRFAAESAETSSVVAFSASTKSLGYTYQRPKNDTIGVMMPFSGEFGAVYQAIKSACSKTSLGCTRADEVWKNSVLINDILEVINHSAVVICDLTGRNENVFYELGIAHAWGKTVIPITQNASDVPFDLRHHRFLTYLNNEEGRNELELALTNRLISLVGDKPPF